MRRQELDKKVAQELDRIPRDTDNDAQMELRMLYNMHRRRGLTSDPSIPARESLRKAIAVVGRDYPGAPLEYDREFFGL